MKRLIVLLAMICGYLSTSAQLSFSVNESEGCAPLPVIISVDSPDPNTITSYSWQITLPNNNVLTSTASQYINIFSIPGSYDVTLTINGNETVTVEDFITVHQPPQAGFSTPDAEGCAPFCTSFVDETVAVDGAIVEWSWDFGNGVTSTEQNPDYCYNAPGNFTPVLSVEDEFGCFSSIAQPQLIAVNDDYPVASFEPSSFNDCNPPSDISFTNTSTGEDLSCEWDFGDGFTQSSVAVTDVEHVFTDYGVYDICLTVEDATGCVVSACQEIQIVEVPEPSYIVSEMLLCAGGTVVFEDTSNPEPTLVEWDIDGDGEVDATGDAISYTFDQPGIFEPNVQVTYSENCTSESEGAVSIEVLNPINIAFSADDNASCIVPFPVSFTNESTAQNITGYEWLIDGVSVGTTSDLSYTFTDFGTYDVALVVNTTSCSDTLVQQDFIITEEPNITFDLPDVVCTGESVILSNVAISSVEEVVDALWDFDEDGVTDATGEAPTFVYNDPGTYTVEVVLITVSGCTSTITADQTILVQPNVVSEFASDAQVSCAGEPITFCTDMVEEAIYAWNFGDNTGWQSVSFPDSCLIHDYQDTGYFDVTLSVYNLACNALLVVEDYIYIPPPIAEFDILQDCSDLLTVDFFDDSIEADSLIWDFGDGSPFVYNELNPSHTFPGPGQYTVTLTVFNDETGCFDNTSTVVLAEVPDIHLAANGAVGCAPVVPNIFTNDQTDYVEFFIDFGNGETLEAVLNNQNLWDVIVTYDDGSQIYDDFSFGSNFIPNSNSLPDIIYDQGGTYDITITATDESGCSYTNVYEDIVTVYNDLVFADFSANVIDGCDEVIIGFEPTGNFITTYSWEFSDGSVSNASNPIHQFFPPWDTTFAATLTAIDQFGCTSSDTLVLDLVAPPVPNFEIETDPSCIGDSIFVVNTSTGNIVSYGWDFGNPADPNNQSILESPVHAYFENGSYDICLTVENSQGCQQTLCQQNVVSIVSPVADFDYDSQMNNCLFGVQFTNTTPGNIVSSFWDFGDEQFGSGDAPFHTYSIGVYDVELVVTNEYGCIDTLLIEDIFNLSNVIGPYSVTLDNTSCAPFQTTFEAYNINDQSFTYFWEFDDGFGDPNNNTVTNHTFSEPGTYCPSLIMEDANGCPILIECEEPIVVEEFVFDYTAIDPICFGDSLQVTFTGGQLYSFDQPELFTSIGGDSYWLQADQTTDILVTGYFEDCVHEENLQLVVNPLPVVSLDLPVEICHETEVLELDGGLPAGPGGVYTIDGVESTVFDPAVAPEQSYEVIYTYTDENQCVSADTTSIFINALPVVAFPDPEDVCEEDEIFVLEGASPIGGSYYLDDVVVTEIDPSSFGGFGEQPLTYSYTDANGCTSTDDAVLVIHPQPIVSFDPPELCWQPTVTLQSTSQVAQGFIDEYTWDVEGNGQITGTDAPLVNIDGPGTVDVTLTVVSDAGCEASHTDSIMVYATPVAEAIFDDLCVGDAIVFDDLSSSDAEPITTWQWSVNGELYSTDQFPDDLIPDQWGNYDIQLYVATSEGCEDSFSASINAFPLPEISVSYDDICASEQAMFMNSSTIPSTSITSTEWYPGTGDGPITTEDLNYQYENAGEYDVSLQITSSEGCVADSLFSIEVFPMPAAAISSTDLQTCADGTIDLLDASTIQGGQITTWNWFVNGDLYAQTQNTTFSTDVPGVYDVTLLVASNQGCSNQVTEPGLLEIWPVPVADFSFTPDQPDSSTPFIIVTDQSEGASDWEYTISDGAFYNSPDFEHEFIGIGLYDVQLVVTNGFGCTDTLLVEISVDPTLVVHVPNAFTPDNDGLNEVFKPVVMGTALDHYRFSIYDRWGDQIFVSEDPNEGWHGNVDGGEYFVQTGVYVWRLEIVSSESGEREIMTGHVTILR